MKIIILGASGMLGHMVSYYFKKKFSSDVILCSRTKTNIDSLDKILKNVSEYSIKTLSALIDKNRPCKIINCVGIKNSDTNKDELEQINSKLPKILASILDKKKDGSQLVHISTNGIFSGRKGNYVETDKPDPINNYGKSKLVGEVSHSPHLTIRTSIIGPELKFNKGLFEWFLSQKNEINGYTEVKWNGVTTLECAKFIDWVINKKVNGLIHLFSTKISKYDLFNITKEIYGKNIKVTPDDSIKQDLTLNTSRTDIKYNVPKLSEMLNELKNISFS
tara:strand:+ start:79 stop:909 length:831 start_codon:yes stop_codon:yes gene_type:complete